MSSNTAPSRQQDTNIKVPLISRIAYGMGDVGCNFSWMFVGNFLMIFYTDVCGISMAAYECTCYICYSEIFFSNICHNEAKCQTKYWYSSAMWSFVV